MHPARASARRCWPARSLGAGRWWLLAGQARRCSGFAALTPPTSRTKKTRRVPPPRTNRTHRVPHPVRTELSPTPTHPRALEATPHEALGAVGLPLRAERLEQRAPVVLDDRPWPRSDDDMDQQQ
jgi:hypothetical protein